MNVFDVNGCEQKIGYVFKDKMLLRQCFTHSSYANEHNEKNNELLEFFGDSVIQFIVTEYLCVKHKASEGKLTAERAKIVSRTPLLNSVYKLGLNEFILLGKGQGKNFTKEEKLFSSVYEALVAGIYIDGGMAQAKRFIKRTIIFDYEAQLKAQLKAQTKDAKSSLQEYVQGKRLGKIEYVTLSQKGPDHCPKFVVALMLNGKEISRAEGKSKKVASSLAAQKSLKILVEQEGRKN